MQLIANFRRLRNAAACAIAGTLLADTLAAQDNTPSDQNRWITAFSVGIPGSGDQTTPLLFTLAGNFTQDRLNRPALDVSLGTAPWALTHGVAILGARFGLALPLAISPGLTLVPSAGGSLVAAMSEGGGGGLPGTNVGLALLVRDEGGCGLRVGVTSHSFGTDGGDRFWLLEVGMVRANRKGLGRY